MPPTGAAAPVREAFSAFFRRRGTLPVRCNVLRRHPQQAIMTKAALAAITAMTAFAAFDSSSSVTRTMTGAVVFLAKVVDTVVVLVVLVLQVSGMMQVFSVMAVESKEHRSESITAEVLASVHHTDRVVIPEQSHVAQPLKIAAAVTGSETVAAAKVAETVAEMLESSRTGVSCASTHSDPLKLDQALEAFAATAESVARKTILNVTSTLSSSAVYSDKTTSVTSTPREFAMEVRTASLKASESTSASASRLSLARLSFMEPFTETTSFVSVLSILVQVGISLAGTSQASVLIGVSDVSSQ
mmetsp:Transcript_82277/g.172270  ORF Transcript_82277/g.172270 Transcript_82277/m.172270 type:complete len:301 (+) Transcript_82277:480-1382(+)